MALHRYPPRESYSFMKRSSDPVFNTEYPSYTHPDPTTPPSRVFKSAAVVISQLMDDPRSCVRTGSLVINSEHAALNCKHALRHSGLATTLFVRGERCGETVQEAVQEKAKESSQNYRLQGENSGDKKGRASIPDSRCAAHIKCEFGTFWPFRKTTTFKLALIRIRATSADLRRVCIDTKTVGVAAAHDIAAAKVRVAQKSC